jgi:hypothetical protein
LVGWWGVFKGRRHLGQHLVTDGRMDGARYMHKIGMIGVLWNKRGIGVGNRIKVFLFVPLLSSSFKSWVFMTRISSSLGTLCTLLTYHDRLLLLPNTTFSQHFSRLTKRVFSTAELPGLWLTGHDSQLIPVVRRSLYCLPL